jgi:rubrerythrin
MKTPKLIGANRTGTRLAPERCEEMLAATTEFPPSSQGDASALAVARLDYASSAEPVGTMPPPGGIVEGVKTAAKMVRGQQPVRMLDKLGERLAFERTGVRLYEALLSKHDTAFKGGPSRQAVQHILDEEREHFTMLREMIEAQGGDPTAITPSANVHATASKGLGAVLTDPRTTFVEGLEAVLIAELTDNECWDGLIGLADAAGDSDLLARFTGARDREREHLDLVRGWLAAAYDRDVTGALPYPPRRRGTGARASRRTPTKQTTRKPARGRKPATSRKRAHAR